MLFAKRAVAAPLSRRVFLFALTLLTVCAAGIVPAAANRCSTHNSDARVAGTDPDWDDGWVIEKHGNVCTITDRDDGSMEYYRRSEGICRSMPGFVEWQKDRGAGYNRCIFNPPSGAGTPSRPSTTAPAASGPNSCEYANDGECDEPGLCSRGTDTNDCRAKQTPPATQSSPRPRQEEKSPYVEFTVCNKSSQNVSVAYGAKRNVGDRFFKFSGWRRIEAGACDVLGRFVKGYVYVHASGVSGGKWGDDKRFCVRSKVFNYYRDGVGNCSERSEMFSEIYADKDKHTLNLN